MPAALRYGLRAAWARRPRWLGFVLTVAVGLAVVGTALGVATRASDKSRDTVEREGANRVIEIEGSLNTGEPVRLTASTLARIERLAGVERVLPSSSAAIGLKNTQIRGVLLVASTLQTSRPPMVSPSGTVPSLHRGEALLPARAQGADLLPLLGRGVAFDITRAVGPGTGTGARYRLRVVGLYEPSFQADGQDVAYVALHDDVRLAAAAAGLPVRDFARRAGFDDAEVLVRQAGSIDSVLRQVQRLGLPATTLSQRLSELPTILALGQDLGRLLAIVLLVLVVATTASQTGSAVRARRSEIGVLRAVGYGRGAVAAAFIAEAIAATAAALVLGIAGALVLSAGTGRLLRDYLDRGETLLPSLTLPALEPMALIVVATVASAIVGAGVAAIRAARLDPSLALRPS
ncbi:MAG: ABC transporter permease [Actinobacteria bacterium]|nr:ABC transporter permease [Actinomycetota bacterium]